MHTDRPRAHWFTNMHINIRKPLPPCPARGFTLVELMIALTIMLIVSLATVKISAGVFRTNTQSIHMTQLSQEMRTAIQIISRDIRRSGYKADALAGFLTTLAISSGVTMGQLDADGVAGCLQIQYDDISEKDKLIFANVVYRLRVVSSVGRVSAHFDADADCDTSINDAGWVDISDPLMTHITALRFILDDSLTDIAENLSNGNTIQVGLEQVSITIIATLRSNQAISRSITNEVQMRNHYLRI